MKQLFFALLLLAPCLAKADIKITGTIKMPDGKNPPILARVSLTAAGSNRPDKNDLYVETSNGKFSISAPQSGAYKLWVAAAHAAECQFPIILTNSDKNLTVDISLISLGYDPNPENINILTVGTPPSAMKKENDGTFSFRTMATADTFAYQLEGFTTERNTFNGLQADYFIYDGGGDYYSVIRCKKNEEVKIVVDPKAFFKSPEDASPNAIWDSNHSHLTLMNDLMIIRSNENQKVMREYMAAKQRGENMSSFAYNYSNFNSKISAKSSVQIANKELREFAELVKLSMPFANTEESSTLEFNNVPPPESIIWAFLPASLDKYSRYLISKKPENALQILHAFSTKNPDKTVKSIALLNILQYAKDTNNEKIQRETYNELAENYSDNPMIKFTLAQLDPNAKIRVGKPVPDFEVKLLSGSSVSRTSLLGKYYLIDFWAVWCGPCVDEMPKLHTAYNKFKGKKGFDVLSLSFDQSPSDIEKFRSSKFPMPWMHAFVENGFKNQLSINFEVIGIPKPILVNDKGEIVATEGELRSDNLDKTLAKHLSNELN